MLLETFSISCRSLDENQAVVSPVAGPADEHSSQVLFQNPRTLGKGVDNFDERGMPQTPYIASSRGEPPQQHPHGNPLFETPQLQNRDTCFEPDTLVNLTLDDSCVNLGNASTTSTSSSASNANGHCARPQLVLVRGGTSFSGAHITMRLLQGGYNVRILAKDCSVSTTQLMDLVKSRLPPHAQNRLLVYRGCELVDALEGCVAVVCNSEPETGDLVACGDIKKRFLDDMQDLFLSIHSLCRQGGGSGQQPISGHSGNTTGDSISLEKKERNSPVRSPRVIWISTAATVFPVPTTSRPRSQHLIEAKALALREAERIAKKADIPFVVLLPSVMVGSSLTDAKDEAHFLLSHLAKGSRWFPFAPSLSWNFVDVQDVAEAVFKALSTESAVHQRFLLSESELSIAAIGGIIRKQFPMLRPATTELPNVATLVLLTLFGHLGEKVSFRYLQSNLGRRYPLENHKARRALGVKFHPAADAIVASVGETLGLTPTPSPPCDTNNSLSTSSSQASIGSDGASKSHEHCNHILITDNAQNAWRSRKSERMQARSSCMWVPRLRILLCVATLSLGTGIAIGFLSTRR